MGKQLSKGVVLLGLVALAAFVVGNGGDLFSYRGAVFAEPAASQQSSAASQAPYAGLGSDRYAAGVLPLGDGKYVTNGPKKGYIYLCNTNTRHGGRPGKAPWISGDTWRVNAKPHVEGSVMWPNASISISVEGATRRITTNDLPKDTPTGIFPIQRSDPASVYDLNPNSIQAQSFSFSLPAYPQLAAAPVCVGRGAIGVMTNGVMLFNGFDAQLRDAAAHEVQDRCDGHPQSAGVYHYHGPSPCLEGNATTVIGFAFDGFPITGSKLGAHRYLTTADLDECHGITGPIRMDGKLVTMYHYVMTEDFPYSVGCFRGTPAVRGPVVPRRLRRRGRFGPPPRPMP